MKAPYRISNKALRNLISEVTGMDTRKRTLERFIERTFGSVHRRLVLEIPTGTLSRSRSYAVRQRSIDRIEGFREDVRAGSYPDVRIDLPKVIAVKATEPNAARKENYVLRYEFDIQHAPTDTAAQRAALLMVLRHIDSFMGVDEWTLPAELCED